MARLDNALVAQTLTLTLTRGGGDNFPVVVAPALQGVPGDSLTVNHGLADQRVVPDARTEIQIPADAFAHTDPQAAVQLVAAQADGKPLPEWVRFDQRTGKFAVKAPAGVADRST